MVLGSSNYNFDLSLDNSNIEIKDELKFLGVTIDSKLSYTTHIKNILCTIHAKAGALRRICNFIDSKTAMRIYKVYILSHFDYCSPLFVGLSSTLSNKIERTHFYILRTLFKFPKSIEYAELLSQLNLESINQRQLSQPLAFIFKG